MAASINLNLLPGAIAELLAYSSISGVITLADRYGLLAALLEDGISEEERFSIDRILRAIRQGHLKVTNEISALA